MARISAVIATSHTPFLFQPAEWWSATQSQRHFAEGCPVDSDAENRRKIQRIDAAFEVLRGVIERAKPDVLLIFGDDQDEQFGVRNYPAFAILSGEDLAGYREVGYTGGKPHPQWKPKTPENWTTIKTHAPFARYLTTSVMREGFDPAFMAGLPREDLGLGHAFTRPVSRLDPGFTIPIVPVLVNCYYPPQPTAARCLALARALRGVVERWTEDISVAAIGSGGLWHTPGARDAYLDEDFDQTILAHLKRGDPDAAARYFDGWTPPAERRHLRCYESFEGQSRMPGGVGSGSGETRTWIMAAGIGNKPAQIVDYVPIHASPVGAGFAYWEI